ncbi:dihydroneopterin aldolase [Frigidibacter sp. RF13]|uniref:dihydroneopterin aldolase n=1 Tax=Frigidibacter sp. RF13 TaxID=2997340 RepID=UPI002271CE1E|nr:dihydroneopterin aldolase [Frigidibacter sp. RF13]MCY1127753.1 dihydroneopterin aldolase [Frigidibacter sp. RF13]
MQSTDDIGAVFGPLEGSADMSADRLILRDYVVSAEIGAFQHERGQEQRLRFSVVVELAPHDGPAKDDVDQILSYDRLIEAVDVELGAERLDLLETLAERIAARVLAEPQAAKVYLRIEKLDRGPWILGVEIARDRASAISVQPAPAPRPVVAWLGGSVVNLAARMDGLVALGQPVVIVLGPPDLPRPRAHSPEALRRIDLLAIEQAAWALASRDDRLSVVATRTEIDWALRQGRIIVWAPAKMVSDTSGAPMEVGDGLPLAEWLARELDALKIVTHAPVAPPAESRIPVDVL